MGDVQHAGVIVGEQGLMDGDRTTSTLRVLMIVESAAGGTGRHVLDLAESLTHRGCEVHVAYSTCRIDRMFEERLSSIPEARRIPLPLRVAPHLSDVSAVRRLRRHLRQFGPFDIVHGHSSKGGALARLAALGKGIPAVYTLHGLIMMDPLLPKWKWWLYYSIERLLALRTAKIIAVSPEESRAATRLGFGEARVVTIPNGVGSPQGASREMARRSMGLAEDHLAIGFVGRLVEQKAPEVLVRAFATARHRHPHLRLAMIGDGPLMPSLRRLADDLHVSDGILWLGERNAQELMAGFDVFALPSRKEGLPYVVLEAMALGLPVVATSSAGVEILIEPGRSGEVVPPEDPDAFAVALLRLVEDRAYLQRCGTQALLLAGNFTVERMVDRTLATYLEAMRLPSQRSEQAREDEDVVMGAATRG